MRAAGVDTTFDLYCYLFGSTILGMIALPADVQQGGIQATLDRLHDPATRKNLEKWFTSPRIPLEKVRLGSIPAKDYAHLEGLTLEAAAKAMKQPIGEFVCNVLCTTKMATNCVAPHDSRRTEQDIQGLMRHPTMMAGSDGIYVGGKPHPRGTGCFARYLGHYVRSGVWSLEEAVMKGAYHCARRFGLKDRGLLKQGFAADVIVFDPAQIADRSTFDDGKTLAAGMDHVFVNGVPVLTEGKRTQSLPGRGLRPSRMFVKTKSLY